ncbi:MAG: hypothetical protein L0H96_09390 [Humibacillus sp.]|nr:hypothetical protein [Humibacillus sp.]MDN5777112.1 hypothetical protein [Humibacillus sp.]
MTRTSTDDAAQGGQITDRSRILQLVDTLDAPSVSQLLQIAGALGATIEGQVKEDAVLMEPAFRGEFEARLKVHHATHSKQLDRISFEDAFRAASRRAGRTVVGSAHATAPFIDEVVDGEGVALKTTAARDVRAGTAHISKLCEASWIQDVRGAQAREGKAKEQIRRFLAQADRIYQLRVLPDRVNWKYQLIEIPVELFHPILDLDRNFFAPDGPRIPISDAVGPCMTFVLDRSDAKITIAKIPVSRCIVHAEWTLPKKDGDLGSG